MRIVGGEYRNRKLIVPKDDRVRPTADRVREAWMSILGSRLADARVLDLFSGSGALGLEALSRGARHATFVEINGPSLDALRTNIATLGAGDRVTVHRSDALRFASELGPDAYDVVFADPPYAHAHATTLVKLFRAIPFAGTLSVEHAASENPAGDDCRRYGDTALTFCHADSR